jgi:ribulose-phosphate 3-epimerase
MISQPEKYADTFAKYCDRISFHAELFENDMHTLKEVVSLIKENKVEVGLVLNPDKPLSLILPVLDMSDYILIMSVHAGHPGQKFIPDVLDKIKELRQTHNYKKDIEIDGGINDKTIKSAYNAGANVFIAGSAIFNKKDRTKSIQKLRRMIK